MVLIRSNALYATEDSIAFALFLPMALMALAKCLLIKLIQYRFRNESYKKSFIFRGVTIYFAIITLLIDMLEKSTVAEWISCVGMLLETDYYIRHAKNIWGIKWLLMKKIKK